MNRASLEAFLAVAGGNGVRGAAKLLARLPATISHQIRDLEANLEATLFVRAGKQMLLTPAGETFRQHATEITQSMRRASAAVRHATPSMRLRLGVSTEASNRGVLHTLTKIGSGGPEHTLDVTVAENSAIIQMAIAGEIDGAFVIKPPRDYDGRHLWELCQKSLSCVTFSTEDLLLLQSASRPGGPELGLEKLAVHRLDDIACFLAERVTKAKGVETLPVSSEAAILALLAAGSAYAALPRSSAERISLPFSKTVIGEIETMLVFRDGPWQDFLCSRLEQDGVAPQEPR